MNKSPRFAPLFVAIVVVLSVAPQPALAQVIMRPVIAPAAQAQARLEGGWIASDSMEASVASLRAEMPTPQYKIDDRVFTDGQNAATVEGFYPNGNVVLAIDGYAGYYQHAANTLSRSGTRSRRR